MNNSRSEEIVDNPDSWVTNHIREYVATDGRRGHRPSGWKVSTLLLVTRGRRSGKLRRTALAYTEHDGRYVIVASNGGARRHPDWYRNLVEDPAVQVQVRDDRFAARARDARAAERPALWKLLTSLSPALDDYHRKSGREIPVVILERISRAAPGETALGASCVPRAAVLQCAKSRSESEDTRDACSSSIGGRVRQHPHGAGFLRERH
jgi:deazaflavin-dependent oxidoreductase (nitroreductase family)